MHMHMQDKKKLLSACVVLRERTPPLRKVRKVGTKEEESAHSGQAAARGRTWNVSSEQKLMTFPRRRGTMCWPAACERSQTDLRFTLMTCTCRVRVHACRSAQRWCDVRCGEREEQG